MRAPSCFVQFCIAVILTARRCVRVCVCRCSLNVLFSVHSGVACSHRSWVYIGAWGRCLLRVVCVCVLRRMYAGSLFLYACAPCCVLHSPGLAMMLLRLVLSSGSCLLFLPLTFARWRATDVSGLVAVSVNVPGLWPSYLHMLGTAEFSLRRALTSWVAGWDLDLLHTARLLGSCALVASRRFFFGGLPVLNRLVLEGPMWQCLLCGDSWRDARNSACSTSRRIAFLCQRSAFVPAWLIVAPLRCFWAWPLNACA